MFVGVGYGLPAALPRASPRLKILMAPHWYCRVTPGRVPAGSVSRENSCALDPWVKIAGGYWCGPKRRFRSGTKIGPRDAYHRGLRLKRDPEDWPPGCPFTLGWSVFGVNSCSRDPVGKCVRRCG